MHKATLSLVILLCLHQSAIAADPVSFPWCPSSPASPGSIAPYQVLQTAGKRGPGKHHIEPLAIQVLPKTAYDYGWFGSNPHPYAKSQWGQHFGSSKNYTQWTSR